MAIKFQLGLCNTKLSFVRVNQTRHMISTSFTYQGKKYKVDQVTELESDSGNRRIQVTTKCHKKFELTFKESIFKWVISESPLSIGKISQG